jgi:hypothetical protein
VNVVVVDVPPELVSVTVAVYVPTAAYACVVVGVVVVAVDPSPNVQAYDAMLPYATVDADASKLVARPSAEPDAVKVATGGWSGATTMPAVSLPAVIGVPGVFVAVSIGVTRLL